MTGRLDGRWAAVDALFIRSGSRPIPRVVRMMRVARELGFTPGFCGAKREPGLPDTDAWAGFPLVRVGPSFPLLNGRAPGLYARSISGFNRAVFRVLCKQRPGLVHASDIESFPAAGLYATRERVPVIYNIHDNLAQRYDLPAPIRAFLNWLEGAAVLASTRALVPEAFRRDALPQWCRRKVEVIRNTPDDPGSCEPPPLSEERVVLFYAGWIDRGRGFGVLLDLLDLVPGMWLRVAGEGDPELIATLQRHPRVTYLGFVDHDRVLEETAASHFVPALYNPSRVINRFAASNKMAEAFAIGRPIITNSELAVAVEFRNEPCLVATRYGHVSELAERLARMVKDRSSYRWACFMARRLYERAYSSQRVRAISLDVLTAVTAGGSRGLRRPVAKGSP